MKKLLYIFSNIRESIRSHPIAYIIVIFAAIVSGFVSTITYDLVKVDVKDISLITCNRYSFSALKEEHVGEGTLDSVLDFLTQHELIEDKANPQPFDIIEMTLMDDAKLDIRTASGDSLSSMYDIITLSWSHELFSAEDLEKGNRVVVLNSQYARMSMVHKGDDITINGDQFRVLDFVDAYHGKAINIAIPYTTRFTNIRLHGAEHMVFVAKDNISKKDISTLNALYVEPIHVSNDVPASVIIFILSTIICALNVLVATSYIARKCQYKYAISKVLGATNLFTAIMLLFEVAIFAVIGILIGVFMAYGLLVGLGIVEYFTLALTGADFAIIICFDVFITLLVSLIYIIKSARKQPIER